MTQERDKFLTEAMGGVYHQAVTEHGVSFCDCGVGIACNEHYTQPSFSTWQGFGKLWDWARGQEWWGEFWNDQPVEIESFYESTLSEFTVEVLKYVHPDRFADAVYEFLKEQS